MNKKNNNGMLGTIFLEYLISKNLNFGAIVGCAAGHMANDEILKELTDNVVHLDSADSSTLKQFFKWVSETIEQGNKSQGTGESVTLPPPPSEITVVI